MEKKTSNLFLNFVSEKLLHTNTASSGKQFTNVSIPCDKSVTGYASFGVNMGQILPSTRRDGTVIDGYKSVLLGKPETERTVSICTAPGAYENIKMTNQAIADAIETNCTAYRAARKAPAAAA